MPAPTALKQPPPAPEQQAAPAITNENEDELLIDIQQAAATLTDPNAAEPPEETVENEMAVDEEGRPRFAPGKNIVCCHII
jgi:hypothetical protein